MKKKWKINKDKRKDDWWRKERKNNDKRKDEWRRKEKRMRLCAPAYVNDNSGIANMLWHNLLLNSRAHITI